MQIHATAIIAALLPTLALSCSTYGSCMCQNADNSANNAATKKICANFAGNYISSPSNGRDYCSIGVANVGIGGGVALFFNNCRWRTACNNIGAAGDSSCWAKQ
ncbi:uncharacterized protein ColSpa_11609 [Colletotrichum spaethianum]|uniref:Uncharacterized protein n=1 Tax=Colletotrichum spaethianum TaxID=700344 RepID=A0AA37PFM6_9PEZI|nr:uncharacterized protein ColSpa_11609 [Colletotrichum spaethianum]GKT51428.1 hypothetical protein ColSpa_11609 [Colletotrichum spaethianum]